MAKVIYEAKCPACGKMVEFENIGWKICPHCKGARAEFGVNWEIIEEKEDKYEYESLEQEDE